MPSLILLKSPEGVTTNKHIQLSGDAQVIGRDQERCQIVIQHHAVSREHAKITAQNGTFFIEDLKSRNHTFVNSKEVPPPTRQPLKPDDRIKICDFLFRFHDERVVKPKELPDWMAKNGKSDWQSIGSANRIEDPLRLSAGQLVDLNAGGSVSAGASVGVSAGVSVQPSAATASVGSGGTV